MCRRPGVTLGLRDPLACVPVNLGRAGPVLVGDPHPPPGLWATHLVCDLDEEAAALPGGKLQPGGDAVTGVPHPGVGTYLQHLGREAARLSSA